MGAGAGRGGPSGSFQHKYEPEPSVGRVLVNLEPGPRIPASVGSGRPGQLKLIFRYYSQIKIH